jgi:outer membrane protein assembly factor BamB
MAKGPYATPLIRDHRLYTVGGTAVVAAWDAATGRPLWTNDFSRSVETSKLFCGTAASPLAINDVIVVQVGSDVHGGRILALNPTNGSPSWTWTGPGPGYASPITISLEGTTHLVTLTESSVIGLDALSGLELWTIPFPDEWHENIATPLWTGSHLILSGTRQGTHAYALARTHGQWHATQAWKNKDAAMYMSSPVLGDGLIYGHSSKQRGQFIALDPKTGAIRWSSEGRDGDHASVLLTPDHVLFLAKAGDLTLARRGATRFEVVRRYKLPETDLWAMPILTPDGLLVRNSSSLVSLQATALF